MDLVKGVCDPWVARAAKVRKEPILTDAASCVSGYYAEDAGFAKWDGFAIAALRPEICNRRV